MGDSAQTVIKEGKACIHTLTDIFYNPVQEFNRDLSVTALTVFIEQYSDKLKCIRPKRKYKEAFDNDKQVPGAANKCDESDVTVLEALAATGLRSIRYALEVPNIGKIYANDCSTRAVTAINTNIKANNVETLVQSVNSDAVWLMQKLSFENKRMDVIDLDPYGCPTRFLDSAVNCVNEGGMLMVTCTDMAVIAGNTPETCYVKYGAVSLRSSACHEMALRIVLQCIASHCARYGRYIVPLLSVSADFYIRVFVQVLTSQKECKKISSNTSMVYQCNGCGTLTLQPLGITSQNETTCKFSLLTGPPVSQTCSNCNHKHRLGGPIWTGKLHDEEFVKKMLELAETGQLATSKRMVGLLSVIKEELHDIPLYYTVNYLCSKLHCQMISLKELRCALLNGGYRVSLSHCKTNSVKTDAPASILWDILRYWVKAHPISTKRLQGDSVAAAILKQDPKFTPDFSYCNGAIPPSCMNGLLRYQINPVPNWGPGTRARTNTLSDTKESKSKRNQNKHKVKKRDNIPCLESYFFNVQKNNVNVNDNSIIIDNCIQKSNSVKNININEQD